MVARKITDLDLLNGIDDLRRSEGSVTHARLARHLGVADTTVRERLAQLRDLGLVEWSQALGSIRRVEGAEPPGVRVRIDVVLDPATLEVLSATART